ncbi:MAG: 2,3-diphosphoglycerate synthetase [Egibacteraceae bacterium]
MLVDGEHYPPVIRAAFAELAAGGTHPVAALFLGGTEKVAGFGAAVDLGVPIEWAGEDTAGQIRRLISAHRADVVVDLSDEPVLDARRRMRLAAHVLHAGVAYEGADFRFTPPPRSLLANRPSVAVIGTSKRTGKTAVCGEVARVAAHQGRTPVIVAMGRGGPEEPVVVPANAKLDTVQLLRIADEGGHAASDFYEDAVTTGVATVGARRCGGGLAGAVSSSTVAAAVQKANELPGDLLLLEGSGAAIPPAHADATLLVVPGDCDPEFVRGYLGAYRVLLADLVVVTMSASPRSSPAQVEAVLGAIRSVSQRVVVVRTILRPVPLGMVSGAKVFFATTAPTPVAAVLAAYLQERYCCEVVATSSRLADRPALRADLERAGAFDVLLVELKAAAVDVAARAASAVGARMVVCDNRPSVVGPAAETEGEETFVGVVTELIELADTRFAD